MDENRKRDAIILCRLALGDYLACRILLKAGLLPQASGLAATSVEKLFKSLFMLSGKHGKAKRRSRHLNSKFIEQVVEEYSGRFPALDKKFLEFLSEAYSLRYLDNENDLGIVLSQQRILSHIDSIFMQVSPLLKSEFGIQLKAESVSVESGSWPNLVNEVFRKNGHYLFVEYMSDGFDAKKDFGQMHGHVDIQWPNVKGKLTETPVIPKSIRIEGMPRK